MKKLMKLINSKIFVAILFLMIGLFAGNHIAKNGINFKTVKNEDDRIPVLPNDQDAEKLAEYFRARQNPFHDSNQDDLVISDVGPTRREDDRFVYYDIKIDKSGNNKLNVEVKDGYIHLKSDSNNNSEGSSFSSSMEQVFSIDSNLDDKKAEVLNESDKIVIKIPKKKG